MGLKAAILAVPAVPVAIKTKHQQRTYNTHSSHASHFMHPDNSMLSGSHSYTVSTRTHLIGIRSKNALNFPLTFVNQFVCYKTGSIFVVYFSIYVVTLEMRLGRMSLHIVPCLRF